MDHRPLALRSREDFGDGVAMTVRDRRRTVDNICDVGGVRVGHGIDPEGLTARSAVLFVRPAARGVDVRVTSTGSHGTDVLSTMNAIEKSGATFSLTGVSTFGLTAANGGMHYLEQISRLATWVRDVSSVPGAVIYDLKIGSCWPVPESSPGHEETPEDSNWKCAWRNLSRVPVCRDMPRLAEDHS